MLNSLHLSLRHKLLKMLSVSASVMTSRTLSVIYCQWKKTVILVLILLMDMNMKAPTILCEFSGITYSSYIMFPRFPMFRRNNTH